jgi:hypothetical protein
MKTMLKILNNPKGDSNNFISQIFLEVPWKTIEHSDRKIFNILIKRKL